MTNKITNIVLFIFHMFIERELEIQFTNIQYDNNNLLSTYSHKVNSFINNNNNNNFARTTRSTVVFVTNHLQNIHFVQIIFQCVMYNKFVCDIPSQQLLCTITTFDIYTCTGPISRAIKYILVN